ncbi:MAG TPA: hypothetical protein VGM31_05560 [Puia sp.]|jgi:hypothetical protein
MTEERFWGLVSIILSNEATPEEITELKAAAEQNPELRTRLAQFTALWNARPPTQKDVSSDAFVRHLKRLNDPQ